jgi:DNA-binding LacI/PurR family transcriptional regulator
VNPNRQAATVTLDQVAKAAGVSRATASRALSGGSASPKATKAVAKAAKRLGFQPNRAAQSLAKRRTGAIALVITETPEFIFQDVYLGRLTADISQAFWSSGLQPMLVLMNPANPASTVGQVLHRGNVDGLVVTSFHPHLGMEQILGGADLPTVFIGRPPGPKAYPFVDADNRDGSRLATKHLLQAGRRHIACLAGPLSMTPAADRKQGFMDAHAEFGVTPGPCMESYFQADAGFRATERLLAADPRIDAVFAQSDSLAMGALRALTQAGRRVPDDVALVGFDDSPIATRVSPMLTTVAQPVSGLAAAAANLLVERLNTGNWGAHPVILPTKLVIRESG